LPYKVVAVDEMRQIESECEAAGIVSAELMQRAGRVLAERIRQILGDRNVSDPRITFLVGGGNNGGDALVAAADLARAGSPGVRIYLLKARPDGDPLLAEAESVGCFIASAANDQRHRVLSNLVQSADLIIDGIFGIGLQLPLREDAARQLRTIQSALRELQIQERDLLDVLYRPAHPARHASRPYVLAVDVPSGIDADTGEAAAEVLRADETLTFIAAKRGLFQRQAASVAGRLTLSTLGISTESTTLRSVRVVIFGYAEAQQALNVREGDSHKGTFGSVIIVGGSENYPGAPALCANAAGRAGAGLVRVAAYPTLSRQIHSVSPEPVALLLPDDREDGNPSVSVIAEAARSANALVIGPGLGQSAYSKRLVEGLLFERDPGIPVVVDADALNVLSQTPNWWAALRAQVILTPHPGEMARLCAITAEQVQQNRLLLAAEKALEWKVVLVLKGANTIIASPDGRLQVVPIQTPALAKAGTGDILTGLIGGLLAQSLSPAEAAAAAVYVHGMAGLRTAQRMGTRAPLASDILEGLANAFQSIEGS